MILKSIIAGPLRQQILYSNIRVSENDNPETLRKKNEIRRQSNYWNRSAHHALAALICTNFSASSLWCTLDFADTHLPPDRGKVSRRFAYMLHTLKKDGRTVRYIKTMEHRHGAGRWHVHCILDGCTSAEVAAAWIYGGTHCVSLDLDRVVQHQKPNGQISDGLAKYMVKELPDKPGQRTFQTSTRGAKLQRPEVIREIVPDDYQIIPPHGCRIVEGKLLAVNPFGSSYGMEWLIPPNYKGEF
jgi:hypothetical protein